MTRIMTGCIIRDVGDEQVPMQMVQAEIDRLNAKYQEQTDQLVRIAKARSEELAQAKKREAAMLKEKLDAKREQERKHDRHALKGVNKFGLLLALIGEWGMKHDLWDMPTLREKRRLPYMSQKLANIICYSSVTVTSVMWVYAIVKLIRWLSC